MMTAEQGEALQRQSRLDLVTIRLASYVTRREAEEAGNYMIPDDHEV